MQSQLHAHRVQACARGSRLRQVPKVRAQQQGSWLLPNADVSATAHAQGKRRIHFCGPWVPVAPAWRDEPSLLQHKEGYSGNARQRVSDSRALWLVGKSGGRAGACIPGESVIGTGLLLVLIGDAMVCRDTWTWLVGGSGSYPWTGFVCVALDGAAHKRPPRLAFRAAAAEILAQAWWCFSCWLFASRRSSS